MAKVGKKYAEAVKLVDKTRLYDPAEAVEVLKKLDTAKFDETVELHMTSLNGLFTGLPDVGLSPNYIQTPGGPFGTGIGMARFDVEQGQAVKEAFFSKISK